MKYLLIVPLFLLASYTAFAQTPAPVTAPKQEQGASKPETPPAITIPSALAQAITDADKDAALHAARLDEARQRWRAQVLLVFVTLGLKLEDYEFVPVEKEGQLILMAKAKPKPPEEKK